MRVLFFAFLMLTLVACAPTASEDFGTTGADLRRCADGATLQGVDVSHHQGAIDWARVRTTDTRFAFIRVADGTFLDRRFQENWDGAASAGITRGAYQFFEPGQDPIVQADLFLRTMGPLEDGDLSPVLDVEPPPNGSDASLSAATLAGRVRQWIDRVRTATGRTPIIYTTDAYWTSKLGGADPQGSALWVANFGATCPRTPNAWTRWSFFQYTETGRVAGITGAVDRDFFNGDEEALLAFTNASAPAPAPTPAPAAATSPIIVTTWTRHNDGSYDMASQATANVARIEIFLDGMRLGAPLRSASPTYAFRTNVIRSTATNHVLESIGYDASGARVARGIASMDTTSTVAAYIRLVSEGTYDIGLEQASSTPRIEVQADGVLLTDLVSGATRSPRGIVRARLTRSGVRQIRITSFNSSGGTVATRNRTITVP